MGELVVCADLIRRGYEVFRAVAGNQSCDLIAMKTINGKVRRLRVEVKTATEGKWTTPYYFHKGNPDLYDVLAIYMPWSNEIAYTKELK